MNDPTILDDTDAALNEAQAITNGAAAPPAPPPSNPGGIDPAIAEVIAGTLPTPPASNHVLPDGAGDAVTDEVQETLDACKSIEAEGSNIAVTTVTEKDTAITPDTPAQGRKRQQRRDMFAAVLAAKGIDAATIEELTVQREITVGRQRNHPQWATVCSPQMVAFFATRVEADGTVVPRTYEDLEADMLKHCRNDGGKLGPALRYQQLIEENLDTRVPLGPKDGAVAINEHVTQRIRAIRTYVCSVVNELRRRRAVADGLDPKTTDYLAVR